MLSTGIRTPVGIKVFGSELQEIEKIGTRIEMLLKNFEGTRSVFAERVAGGLGQLLQDDVEQVTCAAAVPWPTPIRPLSRPVRAAP